MRFVGALLWLVCASCIEANLVPCGNDQVCPSGRTCVLLENPTQTVCATDDEIAACTGLSEGDRCGNNGACYRGACVSIECGNLRIDPGELCDDGNTVTGDGTCSADCLSDETCGNGVVDPLVLAGDVRKPNEQCDDGNLVSADGCSSTCVNEQPRWHRIEPGVGAIACGGIATDTARSRVVVWGGFIQLDTDLFDNDKLYEWNGVGWASSPSLILPQGRRENAMAFDASRNRIVMYGGTIGTDDFILGDTWEWDGTMWVQRSASGPPARAGHTMVYDGARKRVVMFGGDRAGMVGRDTWEWDGTTWTELNTTGLIPGRTNHVMAYDPKRNVIVVAGGIDSNGAPVADTWELAGTHWTQITTAATPAELTQHAAMAYDVQSSQMIAYGGAGTGPRVPKTYAYSNGMWVPLANAVQPGGVECPMLAVDPTTMKLLLFGGAVGLTPSNATFHWTGTAWQADPDTFRPSPRTYPAAAYDPQRGRSYVFSGNDDNNAPVDSTVIFDGSQWRQIPATGPEGRIGAGMAFDEARGQAVLFGGLGNGTVPNDTWLFNAQTLTWTKANPATKPAQRIAPSIAYDARRKRIVMFGGAGDNAVFYNQTWEWDGTNWTLIDTIAKPPARMGGGIVYDARRGLIVLQHGFDSTPVFPTDLWTYDGVNWKLEAAATPLSARLYFGIAFDHASGRVITTGGGAASATGAFSDSWALDASGYEQLLIPNPPGPRAGGIAFPAPEGHGIVLTAGSMALGSGYAVYDDTWMMRYENEQPIELCTTNVDNDRDGLAGCADADCWARCSPSCPPWATCDMTAPRCGDGTCGPVENPRMCPADCPATASCGDTFCDSPETQGNCPGDCTP